ncbi:trigger factor [Enterovirga rhinocerotis]|uniref:Trigger factor n=1 Tax=Enterovirga rhinocerotis TaxID=1339210 RepID=A0A4V3DYV8_9HYPH|nr:trigger factor [Enterovirga rhinocerotis]TDR94119.1 trigger factor [Enterovirga rhinocerotis]
MQVTETRSEGLRREFKVTLPASELEERLTGELATLKDRVRINGFRPGKVPLAHLRKLYGRSVMAEVVQNAVNEANRKIVDENGLKLALEPKIDMAGGQEEVEKALEAKGDLDFTVALEVLPEFELADLGDVSITKKVAEVSDEDLETAITRMAEQNRSFAEKDGEAANGDRVTVDFLGRIDDVAFEGGTASDIEVDLGSGTFIPGFEEQLLGAKAGEERKVNVTFPENYGSENLAGKAAEFDVTVKAVSAPKEVVIDDELAKGFGMEDLGKLKEAVKSAIGRDFEAQSRRKLKRELLDALDTKYAFPLPEGLVEQEFGAVWNQVTGELEANKRTFADEDTTEEAARAEYRKIAERRVRLGLVLAQVGEKADIKVTDEEVNQALVERVRQYPGQERQVWEFYQKNPNAKAELRAPIFEEKTVDHILDQVKVVEETISREELFRDDEDAKDEAKASTEAQAQ